jgi:hypothetical protein
MRDDVTRDWRRLHNEELSDLYSSPSIIWVIKSRKMKWAGHVTCKGYKRGACRVLLGKPGGKRPLGRPLQRWENNFKMDHQELGWEGMDWIDLVHNMGRCQALVNAVMSLQVP